MVFYAFFFLEFINVYLKTGFSSFFFSMFLLHKWDLNDFGISRVIEDMAGSEVSG